MAYTASCLPGYRLAVGRDGREGFVIAKDMIPDLVITDVMMPFVDGFELVAQLRGNEYTVTGWRSADNSDPSRRAYRS